MPYSAFEILRLKPITKALGALRRDRSGVGAVEFAIVAPLLVMAYLGAFELSVGFTVAGKTARAASATADVVAQQTEVNKAFLANVPNIAKSILAPYGNANYTLKISGIAVTNTNEGTILWSRDQAGGTPYAVNTKVSLPAQFTATNSFVIRTELTVPHELLLYAPNLQATAKTIDLSKTAYFHARLSQPIKCSDC
ncbi:TadE/TadG family type IV pilus assembly protein [Ensifer sp. SL37]|uniref:TadE/TadG family type IV pilus assembly protein n=1 Tax=Ensifer sp. SL37 TaxID=2995137 RepID=UPI0022750D73|nr:TadE/TadG family type IV pilus assembly protein [Ensifer sp. SL37]MCY1742447.1 pilus assembly protein [Ensifer sp. SL37]